MNREEEFQRYAALVDHYESQLASIENQYNLIQAAIMDYQKAKFTVEKLAETKSGNEMLIPIGGGVFTFATSKNPSKVLADVGAGVVIEKNPKDTMKIMDKRIKGLQMNQESLTELSKQIQKQIQAITEKAHELYEQSAGNE